MKNSDSISKPVLILLAIGITLIVVVLWFGLHPRDKNESAAPPVAAGQSTENSAATSLPAPVSAAAETIGGLPPVIPISLTNVQDDAEKNLMQSDSVIQTLPGGTQIYGGMEFWLQGFIHLQSLATRDEEHRNFRTRIMVPLDETNSTDGVAAVMQRGSNIVTIYLLGAARYSSPQTGETFATVILHYAGGSISRNEIKYNVDLRDWWRTPYEDPAQLPNALTRVAWSGPNPAYKDRTLRLYRIAFINPHPEKVIRAIEFASAMTHPSLFVMALTLDPLRPGTRPDDFLTTAELTDPELRGQMQLFVQDAGGNPLPHAQVSSSFKSASASSSDQKYTADDNGMTPVRFPDRGLATLEVNASQDGFCGRKMLWDLKAGDTVPASYTLKLAPEIVIGGTVVDNQDAPITGATISLYRFWTGNDGNPDKKGEQPAFSTRTQTTDDQGHWQAKGLPLELLDHIGFDVKHPDFVGTNYTVGLDGVESQLRAGTLKIILQRGLDVRGIVTDDSDHPIAGATVFAGARYFRERQQMQTDEHGKFHFHRMSDGEMEFSVLARGRSPLVKTIMVKPDMADVVFKLGPGKMIRALVQNAAGEPLPGTRVSLESPNGGVAESYEYDTTTDNNGRFMWDSAPDEPVHFYFYKSGYEQKRRQELKPDVDNIITMRKARTVQGYVLAADTEKPVSRFRVGVGRFMGNDDSFYADYPGMKDYTDANGMFTITLDEEQDDGVKAEADDYAEEVEKLPEADNDVVRVTIHLKPSASIRGRVVAPDGTPLEGVNVGLTVSAPGNGMSLVGTHLRSYGTGAKIATTDAQGKFTLGSPPETGGLLVAVGDLGFTSASVEQVRANSTLVLLPWGRIEGTLKIGGQPGVGKDLLFNLSIPGIGTDFNGFKSTTDDQGQFTFEKVPPGGGAIVRLIKTSANSWTWSDSTSVTIKPAETTQVTLGDNGAVIVGRIRFDNPPTNNAALSFQGNLSGQMPQMPAFNSSAEAQAYFKTPEYQALMKLHKNYTLEMKADGSFIVDDVAPGTYSLSISVQLGGQRPWEHPPLAQGSAAVTVPDSFSPTSPIDIGEIVLKPILKK